MHKKLLSLVLALCLAVSLIPAAFAQELSGECGGQTRWSFDVDSGTLTISGTGAMADYSPEEAADSRPWAHLREQIRLLVIGEGITQLGEAAFSDLPQLEQVRFSSTVTHIRNYCFQADRKLQQPEFPAGLRSIGNRAFAQCDGLLRLELPGSLAHLDAYAFDGCTGLQQVLFRSDPNVAIIMSSAPFRGCTALEEIQVEPGNARLRSIGGALYTEFPNNHTLMLLQYPLGNPAGELVLPDNTSMLNTQCLMGAVHLRSITIPPSVTNIWTEALYDCSGLEELRYQGNPPEVLPNALCNVPLTAYYPADNSNWTEDARSAQCRLFTWLPWNPANPFRDVPQDAFYEAPVLWALENGITSGTTATTFNPNGACLRAQVVTFLHRANGNPEPASADNPFTDVKATDFFYKPVLWAVEKGITNGTSAVSFGSYDVCNRAAVVTFLWRNAGSPEPAAASNPFADVKPSDFFYKAVLWAVEEGITNGLDATHFGPTSSCNRAQVVTFLYRAYN